MVLILVFVVVAAAACGYFLARSLRDQPLRIEINMNPPASTDQKATQKTWLEDQYEKIKEKQVNPASPESER